jgi:hypothetical protein
MFITDALVQRLLYAVCKADCWSHHSPSSSVNTFHRSTGVSIAGKSQSSVLPITTVTSFKSWLSGSLDSPHRHYDGKFADSPATLPVQSEGRQNRAEV